MGPAGGPGLEAARAEEDKPSAAEALRHLLQSAPARARDRAPTDYGLGDSHISKLRPYPPGGPGTRTPFDLWRYAGRGDSSWKTPTLPMPWEKWREMHEKQKPELMAAVKAYMDSRFDFHGQAIPGISMSGGKAVMRGPVVRLPEGTGSFEQLASLSAADRKREIFPQTLAHPLQPPPTCSSPPVDGGPPRARADGRGLRHPQRVPARVPAPCSPPRTRRWGTSPRGRRSRSATTTAVQRNPHRRADGRTERALAAVGDDVVQPHDPPRDGGAERRRLVLLLPRQRPHQRGHRAGPRLAAQPGPAAPGHAHAARKLQPHAALVQALHPEHGPLRRGRGVLRGDGAQQALAHGARTHLTTAGRPPPSWTAPRPLWGRPPAIRPGHVASARGASSRKAQCHDPPGPRLRGRSCTTEVERV